MITGGSCVDDGSGADLAEKFPSNQSLAPGDVVSIDTANPEYVVKSVGANDKLVIGVVSTQPGYVLGSSGYPIALAGRVPVKVTDEGGAIAPGDYLTSSSTPGYAKKAAPGEKTIGQALAAFSGSTGTVITFVNTSNGNLSQADAIQSAPSSSASFSDLNVSGDTHLANLQVSGLASVFDLSVAGHIIGNDDTRGTVTVKAGDATAHHDFSSSYNKTPAVVASPASQAVLYKVSATAGGFDITLPAPATEDTVFNYLVQE
jgi:hypothetical protein